jgi:hypothetical protein
VIWSAGGAVTVTGVPNWSRLNVVVVYHVKVTQAALASVKRCPVPVRDLLAALRPTHREQRDGQCADEHDGDTDDDPFDHDHPRDRRSAMNDRD